jgi:hypothetical protein
MIMKMEMRWPIRNIQVHEKLKDTRRDDPQDFVPSPSRVRFLSYNQINTCSPGFSNINVK